MSHVGGSVPVTNTAGQTTHSATATASSSRSEFLKAATGTDSRFEAPQLPQYFPNQIDYLTVQAQNTTVAANSTAEFQLLRLPAALGGIMLELSFPGIIGVPTTETTTDDASGVALSDADISDPASGSSGVFALSAANAGDAEVSLYSLPSGQTDATNLDWACWCNYAPLKYFKRAEIRLGSSPIAHIQGHFIHAQESLVGGIRVPHSSVMLGGYDNFAEQIAASASEQTYFVPMPMLTSGSAGDDALSHAFMMPLVPSHVTTLYLETNALKDLLQRGTGSATSDSPPVARTVKVVKKSAISATTGSDPIEFKHIHAQLFVQMFTLVEEEFTQYDQMEATVPIYSVYNQAQALSSNSQVLDIRTNGDMIMMVVSARKIAARDNNFHFFYQGPKGQDPLKSICWKLNFGERLNLSGPECLQAVPYSLGLNNQRSKGIYLIPSTSNPHNLSLNDGWGVSLAFYDNKEIIPTFWDGYNPAEWEILISTVLRSALDISGGKATLVAPIT
jgi:hypothetical protein